MEIIFVALLSLIVLDLAAWRWGFDSRDGFASQEWVNTARWHDLDR